MGLTLATSGQSAHQRAMAGVAFLDKKIENWRAKVDRSKLDIMYDTTCMIGELCGSYNANVGKGKLIPNNQVAAAMGFFAYTHDTAGARAEYDALTTAWRDILAAEDAAREQTQAYVATKRITQRMAA